jgi:hypothetical protein
MGAMLGFAVIGTAIAFVIDAPHLLLLEHQHAETVGRVIRLVPNSHGLVEIGYSVDGRTYVRSVPPFGVADLPLGEGKAVPVYYYPSDPAIAFLAPSGTILKEQLPSWIAGSLLGSCFGVVVVFQVWKWRQNGFTAGVLERA